MTRPKQTAYAVVVVSFGSSEVLESFEDSLKKSSLTPTHLVVVENGPDLPQLSATQLWKTIVIHLPKNPGYGSAVNAGIEALPKRINWVLVSNPDVVLEPSATRQLISEAEKRANCGSAGPALVNSDGSIYPSARAVPGFMIGIGHALFGDLWRSNPWTTKYLGDYTSPISRAVGWLSGACLMVNRSAFSSIGGFDSRYFMFMEDVDLGMRFGKAGWANLYVPTARAHHSVGHSTKLHPNIMIKAHHNSVRKFLKEHYPSPWSTPFRILVSVGLRAREYLLTPKQNGRPANLS